MIYLYKYLFLGLLLGSLIFGCSSEQDESPEEPHAIQIPDFSSVHTDDVFAYECADTLQFTAHVTSDSTWLFLPDTTLKVNPVSSGSGAKFQGSRYIFWSKDDEALLQYPQGGLMNCTAVPQEKPWQAARIRGVDFRAVGQEPGWHLEIIKGKQIKYIGNYGEDTVTVSASDPQKEQQRTIYRAETEDHELEVEVIDEPCTDIMNGFEYPFTVSITVDEGTYQGCGRNLE